MYLPGNVVFFVGGADHVDVAIIVVFDVGVLPVVPLFIGNPLVVEPTIGVGVVVLLRED